MLSCLPSYCNQVRSRAKLTESAFVPALRALEAVSDSVIVHGPGALFNASIGDSLLIHLMGTGSLLSSLFFASVNGDFLAATRADGIRIQGSLSVDLVKVRRHSLSDDSQGYLDIKLCY